MFNVFKILKGLTICFLLSSIFLNTANSQTDEDHELIQFSGFVITADSASPVPYATVKIKNEPRGTITNLEGFFSMVVKENDTIEFSSMGFKNATYIIPSDLKQPKKTIVQTMEYDTLTHPEAVVHPWPTKEKFREAFLNLDLPDNKYELAQQNLRAKRLNKISQSLPMDARENYNYAQMRFHNQAFYSGGNRPYFSSPGSGTPIPGSLLNPMAWAKFIDAIRKGKFSE